jgi:hypothetical protein
MRALRARYDTAAREHEMQSSYQSVGGVSVFRAALPSWELLELELGPEPAGFGAQGRSRHRPPEPLPLDVIERLEIELAKRRDAGNPRRGPLTQSAIATRLGLERHRVQQAEALLRVGWELPRSRPEFSANDGAVRWPSPGEARRILASDRPGSTRI